MLNLKDLTRQESMCFFRELGAMSIEEQAAALALLRAKGETQDEILGALDCFFTPQHAETPFDIVDIVGTGGDGIGTFNISTTASIVMASCGAYVAKHGGGRASGKVGSQDLWTALGIHKASTIVEAFSMLQKFRYVYLWAPVFNPGLKQFALLRKNLGFPTIFNIIGPLVNPLQPKKMLIGVYRKDLVLKVVEVLRARELSHALVVHSEDGLDELSISAPSYVAELKNGVISQYVISPSDFGLPMGELQDVLGHDIAKNVDILRGVLTACICGPKADVVALNAGAGLYVAGVATSIANGVKMARDAIIERRAERLMLSLHGRGGLSAKEFSGSD